MPPPVAAPQNHDQTLIEAGGAAAAVIERKERILGAFEERVRDRLKAARPERPPMIIDTLPAFLTRLGLALLPDGRLDFASEYSNIATQHGMERARFTHYALADLIHEYQILRELLVDTLSGDAGLAPAHWAVIHRSIDEAIAEAASSFVRVQDDFRRVFTAALSHDFRGPLANASNYLELLRRNADASRSAHFATRALLNLRMIDRMISELLDVTQAEASGGLSLRVEPCDIVVLARDVLEDLRALHGDRFELRAPADAPAHADGERIKQALHNLLENALKYGRDGSPISVRVDVGEGRLRLSCHNEGEPIPPELLADLFRPFRRAPSAVSGAKPGWGLGLMLVQSIADAHGGGVQVDSSRDLGTTFTLDVLLDAREFRRHA
jgi:signal transduction histidine kinase